MSAWDDLVACAVQGTARRAPDVARWLSELGADAATLGGAPPERLLDAAALLTSRRRAGRLPVTGLAAPEPAPVETRPTAPEVSEILARLDDPRLLPDLVHGLVARGLVVEPRMVLPLLTLARTDRALAAPALAACGARGPWLLAQLAEADPTAWGPLAESAAGASVAAEGVDDTGLDGSLDSSLEGSLDDTAWRLGEPAARLQWLAAARAAAPERAAEAVAATFAGRGESADFRARVIGVLAAAPSPDDEPVLEAALGDRSVAVRAAAADALRTGGYAAYGARMAARARDWARLRAGSLGRRALMVELPLTLDEAARRDLGPSAEKEGRARWLTDVVAATPLSAWADLGGPLEACRLPVTPEWEAPLREGWVRRALQEGDGEWAAALLRSGSGVSSPERLAPALPPAVQVATATALMTRQSSDAGVAQALAWLLAMPTPWPTGLLRQLLGDDALIPFLTARGAPSQRLLDRLALREEPRAYQALERVAPALGSSRIGPVSRAITTMRARVEIRRALDDAAARVATPNRTPPPEEHQ